MGASPIQGVVRGSPTDPRILAAAPIPPRAATAQWISDQRRAFREQMLAKEAAESAAAAKPAKVVEVII
jgi:hypothetical protein